jgi:serine/threonine protein kinase
MDSATGSSRTWPVSALRSATSNFAADRLLGEGGFGEVFSGTLDGQEVAVKRMSASAAESAADGEAGFLAELRATSAVVHPNVLPVLGVATDEPRKCLVYPLMRGGSLADALRHGVAGSRAPLTPLQRAAVASGAAQGLAALHAAGIVHRDVKGSNILLSVDLTPLLADMGLCRVLRPSATYTTTRRMGTDGFIDPEYSETLELREQSDTYSFGVVLLTLLTDQDAYTEGRQPPGLVGRFRQHLRSGAPVLSFCVATPPFQHWLAAEMLAVAEHCLTLPGVRRPKMRDVCRSLERIHSLALTAGVSPNGDKDAPAESPAELPASPPPVAAEKPRVVPKDSLPSPANLFSAFGAAAPLLADVEASFSRLRSLADWASPSQPSSGFDFAALQASLCSPDSLWLSVSSGPRSSCAGSFEHIFLGMASPLNGAASDGDSDPTAAVPPGDLAGLEAVAAALRRAAAAAGGAHLQAGPLTALADGAESQLRAAAAGGVEAIVQAMRLHPTRPMVLKLSVWALAELARQSAVGQEKICALGGLEAAASAMDAHSSDFALQHSCCALFAATAVGGPDCARAAFSAGGVRCAAAALRAALNACEGGGGGAQCAGLSCAACWAIAGVAGGDGGAAAAAREEGCALLALQAKEAFPRGVGAAADAAVAALNGAQ